MINHQTHQQQVQQHYRTMRLRFVVLVVERSFPFYICSQANIFFKIEYDYICIFKSTCLFLYMTRARQRLERDERSPWKASPSLSSFQEKKQQRTYSTSLLALRKQSFRRLQTSFFFDFILVRYHGDS